jgi:fructose-bisphosphate aldolase class 1
LFLHQLCHHQRRIEVLVLDIGAKQLALHTGEKVTEGLDGLRERLAANAGMGARLAKWRAVIGLDGDQHAGTRPLCGAVPGSRDRAHCRA